MLATRPRSPSYILVVPLSGILLLELKIARVALEACCSMPLVLLCFRDEDPAEYNDKCQLNSSIHTVIRLRVVFFLSYKKGKRTTRRFPMVLVIDIYR